MLLLLVKVKLGNFGLITFIHLIWLYLIDDINMIQRSCTSLNKVIEVKTVHSFIHKKYANSLTNIFFGILTIYNMYLLVCGQSQTHNDDRWKDLEVGQNGQIRAERLLQRQLHQEVYQG